MTDEQYNSKNKESTSECSQEENTKQAEFEEKSEEKKAKKEPLKFDKDKLWSIKYKF